MRNRKPTQEGGKMCNSVIKNKSEYKFIYLLPHQGGANLYSDDSRVHPQDHPLKKKKKKHRKKKGNLRVSLLHNSWRLLILVSEDGIKMKVSYNALAMF